MVSTKIALTSSASALARVQPAELGESAKRSERSEHPLGVTITVTSKPPETL